MTAKCLCVCNVLSSVLRLRLINWKIVAMNSFSQGIFVFKNGLRGKPDKKKKSSKYPIPQTVFDYGGKESLWNEEFERSWKLIQSQVDDIQANNNDGHLAELCDFVTKDSSSTNDGNMTFLPVAALMTGINKPDHHQYFKLLSNTMSRKKIARTVFLPARDCPNVRTAIETLVSCILSNGRKHNYDEEKDAINNNSFKENSDESDESNNEMQVSDGDEDDDDEPPIKLKRSQYTLDVLQSWYNAKFVDKSDGTKPKLTIIMPNFEEFKPSVLKDLILILSNHCKSLPFVLILGVATSTTALLNALSFTETTCIKLRAFTSQPPNQILDQILDDIILTPKCPFQLSSNVLEYLKTVFVFYDLTTKNVLRSVHYCLLDQYQHGNAYAVCATTFDQAKKNILQFTHDDFEVIRRLPSFRPYIESMLASDPRKVVAMFKDDEAFRKELIALVRNIYAYFYKFYGYVRLLWTLVKDLPNLPMGKRLSDIYMYCQSSQKNVTTTEEFQKCWQLLAMMSKDEFIKLLKKCCKSLEEYEDTYCPISNTDIDKRVMRETHDSFDATIEQLNKLMDELKQDRQANEQVAARLPNADVFKSRTEYYQKIKELQKQAKSETNSAMNNILNFLRTDVIEKHLPTQNDAPPLLELFVFSDYDKIRSHLRGIPRSAIHKALTDPHFYLRCKCCGYEGNDHRLLPTMPDNSIVYGLLLESGQQVNIYDWMSAFNAIVGNRTVDDDEDDDGNIPAEIQAKFTRARAELHFMGFTKNSKRKTDHVTRTTW